MSPQTVAEESIFSSFKLTIFNQCVMCLNLEIFQKVVGDLHSGSYNDIFLYSIVTKKKTDHIDKILSMALKGE